MDIYNNLQKIFVDKTSQIHESSYILAMFGLIISLYYIGSYISGTLLRNFKLRFNTLESTAKAVLLVIGHPDDECMFFGPAVLSLVRKQRNVYLLCLSTGDAEGKGHLRMYELYNSCKVLGIPLENVMISSSSTRPDGMKCKWKPEETATLVLDVVNMLDIDTVVTFDQGGVSGHENHISLFRAVRFLISNNLLPKNCRVFVLNSIGLIRKYSSFLDCFISAVMSKNVFILSSKEHEILKQAMMAHKTQYVWFRKLYMYFSCYTYVNTFNELKPP